jgi:hypothetical protein
MRLSLCVLACLVVPAAALATPYNPGPFFDPLYSTYNETITDNFHTLNYSSAYTSTLNGYIFQPTLGYLERYPQPTTSPFRRYWKGPPQNEHIYLTDNYPAEISTVLANGYVYEGIEGYLYTQQVPGSTALYRLAKFNGQTGDLVHKYAKTAQEANLLISQGWTYDHIAGYVQATTVFGSPAFVNGYPSLPGGVWFGRRCGTRASPHCLLQDPSTWEANYRNNYWGYTYVPSTAKPANARRQTLTFDLWSPDYFTPGQNEHLAIGLHGSSTLNFSNIESSRFHGLGIIIGNTFCGASSVEIEAWWPVGGYVVPNCPKNASPLRNNTKYRFVITVSDTGDISYSVTPLGSSTPVIQQALSGASWFTDPAYPFPVSQTGYFLVPATTATADYTVYLSNLGVSWQP